MRLSERLGAPTFESPAPPTAEGGESQQQSAANKEGRRTLRQGRSAHRWSICIIPPTTDPSPSPKSKSKQVWPVAYGPVPSAENLMAVLGGENQHIVYRMDDDDPEIKFSWSVEGQAWLTPDEIQAQAEVEAEVEVESDPKPKFMPMLTPVRESGLSPELTTQIFVSVGKASMCWGNVAAAGEFDSEQASEVAYELCATIKEMLGLGLDSDGEGD